MSIVSVLIGVRIKGYILETVRFIGVSVLSGCSVFQKLKFYVCPRRIDKNYPINARGIRPLVYENVAINENSQIPRVVVSVIKYFYFLL